MCVCVCLCVCGRAPCQEGAGVARQPLRCPVAHLRGRLCAACALSVPTPHGGWDSTIGRERKVGVGERLAGCPSIPPPVLLSFMCSYADELCCTGSEDADMKLLSENPQKRPPFRSLSFLRVSFRSLSSCPTFPRRTAHRGRYCASWPAEVACRQWRKEVVVGQGAQRCNTC